jgi:thiol peroxidase
MEIMANVYFKGNSVQIKGDPAKPCDRANDFRFVKTVLSEGTLSGPENKIKVVLAVASLDTSVCVRETKKFNEKLSGLNKVAGLVISKDLHYVM